VGGNRGDEKNRTERQKSSAHPCEADAASADKASSIFVDKTVRLQEVEKDEYNDAAATVLKQYGTCTEPEPTKPHTKDDCDRDHKDAKWRGMPSWQVRLKTGKYSKKKVKVDEDSLHLLDCDCKLCFVGKKVRIQDVEQVEYKRATGTVLRLYSAPELAKNIKKGDSYRIVGLKYNGETAKVFGPSGCCGEPDEIKEQHWYWRKNKGDCDNCEEKFEARKENIWKMELLRTGIKLEVDACYLHDLDCSCQDCEVAKQDRSKHRRLQARPRTQALVDRFAQMGLAPRLDDPDSCDLSEADTL